MNEEFQKRIGYKGKIDDVSVKLCKDYNLGKFLSNEIVPTGYEDFNYVIETSKGKFFVKVFRKELDDKDCERMVNVYLEAINRGVNHPKLFKSNQGSLYMKEIEGTKLRLCVMQFIEGDNFYNLGEKPTINDLKIVARQAALIDSMNIKPKHVYDNWAIVNIIQEFEQKKEYILKDDLKLLEPLVKAFKEMNIDSLPHCFIHGDITCTNLMKDKDGKLWIVDFSVGNYYPRIQELAVLACDVCFDLKDKKKSESNFKTVLSEYQKSIRLTKEELETLPIYIRLAHAMHAICASYEKFAKGNNTKENEYFLNHGRTGLRQTT
jgi:Ser/Thr protein kinase RdoA (MazF antagonist)